MHDIFKAWEGLATGTGVIPLIPAGLPAHLKPTAPRLDVGSASQGEQRSFGVPHVFVADTVNKTLQVEFVDPTLDSQLITLDNNSVTLDATIAVPGSVSWEGNNINPNSEAAWVALGSVTADGVTTNSAVYQFLRVKVADAGSTGAVLLSVNASS